MNISNIPTIMVGVLLSCLITPMTISAHESVDFSHPTSVETVDSRLAYPAEIHVQVTDQGVEIKGILKRKAGHKTKRLRGHVDVELFDNNGKLMESKKLLVRRKMGSVRHDKRRKFFAVLPLPKTKEFSVRVRHSAKIDKHEQAGE